MAISHNTAVFRQSDVGVGWRSVIVGVVTIVVAVAAVAKLAVLPTLQTHIDDLLPAIIILEARERIASGGTTAAADDGLRDRLGKFLKRTVGINPMSFVGVSFRTTYAPTQFLVTAAVLPTGAPYRETLTIGRSPSVVFGIVAPALLALSALKLGGRNAHWRALIAATVLACSWEFWFFSAQMSSYAIGVFGLVVMFWLLVAAPASPSRGELWRECAIVAMLPWLQYQLLFLLPAYFAARGWQLAAAGHHLRLLIRHSVPALMLAAPSATLLFVLFLRHRTAGGVNWNAGPNGEFLFQIDPGASWAEALLYAGRFFAVNTWLSLSAVTSFVPESHPGYLGANLLLLGLAVVGAVHLSRQDTRHRSLLVFALVIAATWAALIVTGRVTLSPTRHSLILLPAVALFSAIGTEAIGAWSGRAAIVSSAVAGAILLGFATTYPGEVERRRDPFDEERIYALIAETRPQLIVSYHCTRNLQLMPRLEVPLLNYGCGEPPTVRGKPPADEPTRVLFVSAHQGHSVDVLNDAQRAFGKATGRQWVSRDYTITKLREFAGTAPSEVSWRTDNGSNGQYLTLLERPERAAP
jgi:hypothetical protein